MFCVEIYIESISIPSIQYSRDIDREYIDPGSPRLNSAALPYRALSVEAIYQSTTGKGSLVEDGFIAHQMHVGRGIYARSKEINSILQDIDNKRQETVIANCLESLKVVKDFAGNDIDIELRTEGLNKAAEDMKHTFKGRHVHSRSITPRTIYSKGRQMNVQSKVFDAKDQSEAIVSEQRRFELFLDYLNFSDPDPDPKVVSKSIHGYYAWLYHIFDHIYGDEVFGTGTNYVFIKDKLNLKLLASSSSSSGGFHI